MSDDTKEQFRIDRETSDIDKIIDLWKQKRIIGIIDKKSGSYIALTADESAAIKICDALRTQAEAGEPIAEVQAPASFPSEIGAEFSSVPQLPIITCPDCRGAGGTRKEVTAPDFTDWSGSWQECKRCGGYGKILAT